MRKNYSTWNELADTLTELHISQFLRISRQGVYELFQLHTDYGGVPNFEIGNFTRVDKTDFKESIERKKSEKQSLKSL